jgi:hypothetical protein
MDFTVSTYHKLREMLHRQGFSFQTFIEFIEKSGAKAIILRHDVDKLPLNSLKFARIQAAVGIKSTYYFRVVQGSWEEAIIKEIAGMGHEVGYHYEDLIFAWAKIKAEGGGRKVQGSELRVRDEKLERQVVEIGIESFKKNLEDLRKIVPVKTICMHGSPMSRWDSRLLWKYYDYHDFGIVGEPYFDINFDEVLYLTDTGRRWDGEIVSVRDKAQGAAFAEASADKAGLRAQGGGPYVDWKVKPIPGSLMNMSQEGINFRNKFRFRSTSDIFRAAEDGTLPDKMMITFHPQRWADNTIPWGKELIWQNAKNVIKYFVVRVKLKEVNQKRS